MTYHRIERLLADLRDEFDQLLDQSEVEADLKRDLERLEDELADAKAEITNKDALIEDLQDELDSFGEE